jgi:hypothetical protein
MNTTEKNTRAAAIICHLNAIADNRPRPSIHAIADLPAMDSASLLAELESLLAELHPGNAGYLALVGEFRARLHFAGLVSI